MTTASDLLGGLWRGSGGIELFAFEKVNGSPDQHAKGDAYEWFVSVCYTQKDRGEKGAVNDFVHGVSILRR
jgi:hypothetical protein